MEVLGGEVVSINLRSKNYRFFSDVARSIACISAIAVWIRLMEVLGGRVVSMCMRLDCCTVNVDFDVLKFRVSFKNISLSST